MSKSVINYYLSKVSRGDKSLLEALCAHLAERLVYVPSLELSTDASSGSTSVSVVQFEEGDRRLVPAFTTEKFFKEWQQKEGQKGQAISLFGADLCAALDAETWVSVDPGSDNPVELPPLVVARIAKTGVDGEGTIHAPPPVAEKAPEAPPGEEEKPVAAQGGAPEVASEEESVSSTVKRPIIFSSSAILRPEMPKASKETKPKRSFLNLLKSSK